MVVGDGGESIYSLLPILALLQFSRGWFFYGSGSQPGAILPPREHLAIFGGNSIVKTAFVKIRCCQG